MSKSKWIGAIGLVVAAGWLTYLAVGPEPQGPLEIGETAPDFTLPALPGGSPPGEEIHLADYRGKVVVVNFWATWCPPCIEETPSLEKFAARMQKDGVTVIGVSVDLYPSAIEKFVTQYHLTYPIALDPGQTVSSRFGTFKFPETYILDRNGRLAEKIISSYDWQDPRMANFVEALAHPARAEAEAGD